MMWPRAFSSPMANPYDATWVIARPAAPLAVVFKLRCIAGSLAVQLDGARKDTLHRQSSINAAHHDLSHLVDELPDVFLTLARD